MGSRRDAASKVLSIFGARSTHPINAAVVLPSRGLLEAAGGAGSPLPLLLSMMKRDLAWCGHRGRNPNPVPPALWG